MRTQIATLASIIALASCQSAPTSGPLGEGLGGTSTIVATDTARPPRSIMVQLDEPAYVAVLLVRPGYNATLVYPRDSTTDNRLPAGQSTVPLTVPELLARRDSGATRVQMTRQDSVIRRRGTAAGARGSSMPPASAVAPTLVLLLTSPQPLVYQRIIDRTAGVSIPNLDDEALHAVAKGVRATLPEPRALSGYFQSIEPAEPR